MKLIQYWDTGRPQPEIAELIDSVRRGNPDLDHRLYDRERASHFVHKHLGERYWRAFEACAVPAMQADYFRLCALYAKGGAWLDADSRSLRPLAELIDSPLSLMVSHNGLLTTGLMIFQRACDAFLGAVLELATDNIETRRFDNVLMATGPPVADAVRALLDRSWFPGAMEGLDAWGRAVRFGSLMDVARELIPVTPELRASFKKLRIIDVTEAVQWAAMVRPAYKSTEVHWSNWPGSVFRDTPTETDRRAAGKPGGRWVIVAHPDDEVIFAGGAIMSHPEDAWTVVIATHPEASWRAAESLSARDSLRGLGLRIDYRFLGHADQQWHPTGGIDPAALARQLSELGVKPGERVYTHGAPGEYGHNGHKAVHRGVAETLAGTAQVSVFSGGGEVLERIVDPARLARKAQLFDEAYPSQKGVWTGLAQLMQDVMRQERHFALATFEAPASRGSASPAGGMAAR